MARGQGILTNTGDVSELLQTGFTQKAFRRLVEQYPNDSLTVRVAQYIQTSVDSVVSSVSNSVQDTSYSLDRLSNGNNLIELYEQTGNETYRQAFEALRESVNLNTRNREGGLWYYVYPHWSYLDGMYSLTPFYTYYTTLYDTDISTAVIKDVLLQLELLWQHCSMNTTGMLVHGYDESKTAVWADSITGASPHVWGHSLGWYTMALVDTLQLLPISHQSKEWKHLQSRFGQLAQALGEGVDPESGAWWQVLDQPGRQGNYIESSGSAMFVYSLLKGVRLGYLKREDINSTYASESFYTDVASRAYEYIIDSFVVDDGDGVIGYNGTVSVCSLNSTASYEVSLSLRGDLALTEAFPQYYVGQPIRYNSVLGSAAFVLASLEYESHTRRIGRSP